MLLAGHAQGAAGGQSRPAAAGSRACRSGRRAAAGGATSAPISDSADETVPLINGGLAAKALRGRQSIAPHKVRTPQALPGHGMEMP